MIDVECPDCGSRDTFELDIITSEWECKNCGWIWYIRPADYDTVEEREDA